MNPENLKSGDSDDLEALFNEIAEQRVWDEEPTQDSEASLQESSEVANEEPRDVFYRVGSLTRKLHDALRELGYDKNVENAVNTLPDARARLSYIADLTGKAAEKVLAAVESSQKLNDEMLARAAELDLQWDRLYNNQMSLEEFKSHARDNREFLKEMTLASGQLGGHLTEIMMAQDFHDLTGQVVTRIGNMAQNLEEQLVQLLIDTTPPEQRKQVDESFLNGPTINSEGRTDVCSNQSQVDDLLESLGF
jgi:chemotaxis protein CheZ